MNFFLKKAKQLILISLFGNVLYSQVDKVDIVINDIIKKNNINGLQLAVVHDNRIVKTINYGLTDNQDSTLVDSQTVFNIDAMTKAFTGIALIQLVENGKLNLDDPISKYLEDLPEAWHDITIKSLAAHTSGLADIWELEENLPNQTNQILLRNIKKLPLVFQPGERFDYNQANYLLLVMIIEKIQEITFEKYIRENVFEKAAMKNSILPGFQNYYNRNNRVVRLNMNFKNANLFDAHIDIPENFQTANAIYSTASELAQCIIALQNHQLIKEEKNLEKLFIPMVLNNGKTQGINDFFDGYAFGFYTSSNAAKPVIASLGKGGSGMFIYPKDNVSVVMLTNSQGFHPEDCLEQIAGLYIRE